MTAQRVRFRRGKRRPAPFSDRAANWTADPDCHGRHPEPWADNGTLRVPRKTALAPGRPPTTRAVTPGRGRPGTGATYAACRLSGAGGQRSASGPDGATGTRPMRLLQTFRPGDDTVAGESARLKKLGREGNLAELKGRETRGEGRETRNAAPGGGQPGHRSGRNVAMVRKRQAAGPQGDLAPENGRGLRRRLPSGPRLILRAGGGPGAPTLQEERDAPRGIDGAFSMARQQAKAKPRHLPVPATGAIARDLQGRRVPPALHAAA
jgi:hypothetical protein